MGRSGVGLAAKKQPDPRPCSRKDSQRDQGGSRGGEAQGLRRLGSGGGEGPDCGGNWKRSGEASGGASGDWSAGSGDEEGPRHLHRCEVNSVWMVIRQR